MHKLNKMLESKSLEMTPMAGVTIKVEGDDENEVRRRFAKAMDAMSSMWQSDKEALLQRLK